MKLFVQPEDGIKPLLDAFARAKKSIQILIFRFDRVEIEKALVEAAARGVEVQALITFTNRGGDKNLRKLEMRLLEKGITVTRTADDLVRYHGKMFIIDRKELYLLAFNYTHMDISLSRSFGVMIDTPSVVKEAVKLFECDAHRTEYKSTNDHLVVSPVNARELLTKFIAGARKQLLLYEMKISDADFIELLSKKISEGVDVRIIGRSAAKGRVLPTRTLPTRLHTRAIMRDGEQAFLGSQSLRKLELEARREIGVIFKDPKIVKRMIEVFDADWEKAAPAIQPDLMTAALEVPAKKVAKEVAKQIKMKPVVEQLLDRVIDTKSDVPFEPDEVAQTVREAFKQQVQEAVSSALRTLVHDAIHPEPQETAAPEQGKKP